MNYNLALSVWKHGRSTPDALAIASEGQTITYGEAASQAARLAACLRQSPLWQRPDGARPRVGILASRSAIACLGVLGAAWAGATYVPIGPKIPTERLLTLLSLCDLSAIIADDQGVKLLSAEVLQACPPLVICPRASELPADGGTWQTRVDLKALPPADSSEPVAVGARDTAYIIFTSGTTGTPKGVMVSAGSICIYVEEVGKLLDLNPSDRAIETCELTFDFAGHNMHPTWHAGASLHVMPALRAMNAVRFVRDNALTVWSSVPSLAGMLRQVKALVPHAMPSLRITTFGGEQLPDGVVTAWQRAAPNSSIVNLYGPTEATIFCLAQDIGDPHPLTPGRNIMSIGIPMVGSEAAVLDEHGKEVPDGTHGELALAGVQLADGYLNAPELTAKKFPMIDGKRWYLTGDLAMRDSTGAFHCLGRIDNQVKILGHRIELEEVDAHLRNVTNADVVGTVAWPLNDGNAQGLVAFVGASDLDDVQVRAELKTRLPAYMVPSRIVALEDMPFNQSGKVDRNALRQLLAQEVA
ncbi:AMP-binding protein [Variovorax humicola]|uniref:AMP-binding protein n=1 Tax=Variovorax humicola TaxID=1769758 RepID=A0ABU8VUR4_9BURK